MTTPSDFDGTADSLQRRVFLRLAAAALAAPAVAAAAPALANDDAHGAAGRKLMVIDALGGIGDPNLPPALQQDQHDMGINARSLAEAKASGLCAFNMTIGYVAGPGDPFEQSIREIGAWDAFIRRRADSLLKVQTAADIRTAQAQGRIGVIYGFQNGAMMGSDASRVEIFANLGMRVIQLTYNIRNQLGDGSMVAENRGLTELGREVVHALNRNRVLVDLSHSGEQTCLDALSTTQAPLIISHTGCRALADLPRNKTDKELRLVADRGGFVGIYFMPFLALGRQPMAADLIAHIEHAIDVCGEDHVGIGTDGSVSGIDDMNGYMLALKKEVEERRAQGIGAAGERADIVPFLPDLDGPGKYAKLADLLARRGHKAARIEKILGGNFLRVAGDVWI